MRAAAASRLQPFGDRARIAAFDLASLDWWDRMFGADLVVSSLALHHVGDAKKQYFYKAAADRLAPGGALLIADLIDPQHAGARALAADRWDALAREQAAALGAPELFARFEEERWNHFRFPDPSEHPSALLHHLVWLRHAGFAAVDCVWMDAGHAVFGGFKPAAASAAPLRAGN
jgi:SAM-dependent methyltransferase